MEIVPIFILLASSGEQISLEAILFSIIFTPLGIILLYASAKYYRKRERMKDTPTSKIRSMATGLVEVKGKAYPYNKKVIEHPLIDKKCIGYHIKIEEHEPNDEGDDWTVKKMESNFNTFKVRDKTGEVPVKVDGGDPEYILKKDKKTLFGENKDVGKEYIKRTGKVEELGIDKDYFQSKIETTFEKFEYKSDKHRVEVKSIYPGSFCYVMAEAKPKNSKKNSTNHKNLYLGEPKNGDFIISNYDNEKKVRKKVKTKFRYALIFGIFCLLIGVYLLFSTINKIFA